MTTLYIAGPMTGLPEFNYPAFAAASVHLKDAGYEVLSPHMIDIAQGTEPGMQSWAWYMRHALRMLLNAEGVALLPGWSSSRGAVIERSLALDLGMGVWTVADWVDAPPCELDR